MNRLRETLDVRPGYLFADDEIGSQIQHGRETYVLVEVNPWSARLERLYWFDRLAARLVKALGGA